MVSATRHPIWHRALATGWVSNLWDGRVEMELQGTREAVDQMVARLYEQRFIEIEDIEIKEIPAIGEERRFRVR